MTRSIEGSEGRKRAPLWHGGQVDVLAASVSALPEHAEEAWEALAVHARFPGWAIILGIGGDGGVQSFRLEPLATASLTDRVHPERRHKSRWSPEDYWPKQMLPDRYDITARLLRSIPVGEIVRAVRPRLGGMDFLPAFRDRARVTLTGHPVRDERDDAKAAAEYARLVAAGERTPTKALAAILGRSPSQTADYLVQLRKHGLLTPTSSGRAGGRLTKKAREILEGD